MATPTSHRCPRCDQDTSASDTLCAACASELERVCPDCEQGDETIDHGKNKGYRKVCPNCRWVSSARDGDDDPDLAKIDALLRTLGRLKCPECGNVDHREMCLVVPVKLTRAIASLDPLRKVILCPQDAIGNDHEQVAEELIRCLQCSTETPVSAFGWTVSNAGT